MELLKLLSTNELVAQLVSFLILFFLLRALVWKKFLKLLDDRREKIASEFKQIDTTKAVVEKLKSEYESKIRSIEASAQAKIQEAAVAAVKVADDIKKKANEDAQRIIDEAKAYTKYELARARSTIKNDVVDLVINTMEKFVAERLTAEDDKKIVENFLGEIDKV